MTARERVAQLVQIFPQVYPGAHCELNFKNPLQLLVATILSAQCTDKRVNLVTPSLFAKYKTAADYAHAPRAEFERAIQSTGFFRNKTKSIQGATKAIVEKHGGKVPNTMAQLRELPGVGRKTANVVLGNAFGIDEGIVVDTHVIRLSQRLRPNETQRSGKNRAGLDETRAAAALDKLESLAHLARTPALLCATTRLSSLRSFQTLPERKNLYSNRRSSAGGKEG